VNQQITADLLLQEKTTIQGKLVVVEEERDVLKSALQASQGENSKGKQLVRNGQEQLEQRDEVIVELKKMVEEAGKLEKELKGKAEKVMKAN